jgi:hypothetical protein
LERIEKLESGEGQVVGIIHGNMNESPKGSGEALAHNTLGATNDLRTGVCPWSRTRHHGAKLLAKVSGRSPLGTPVRCGELDESIPRERMLARSGEPLAKLGSKTRRTTSDFPEGFGPGRPPAVLTVTLEEVLNIAIQNTGFDQFWLRKGVLSVVFLHEGKRESLQRARSRPRCRHTEG